MLRIDPLPYQGSDWHQNLYNQSKFLKNWSKLVQTLNFYHYLGSVNKKLTKRKRKLKSTDEEEITTSIRVSKETRELLPILANEFIHYITTNAVKICEESDKKTINHEHIVASLKRTDNFWVMGSSQIINTKNVSFYNLSEPVARISHDFFPTVKLLLKMQRSKPPNVVKIQIV